VASSGVATCVVLGVVLVRSGGVRRHRRQLHLLLAQAVAFVLQLGAGLQLIADTHQTSAVRSLAVLTVVFFLVGVARAWQLIGARETGLFRIVGTALRERSEGPTPGSDASLASEPPDPRLPDPDVPT
jgi:hypothetical protein